MDRTDLQRLSKDELLDLVLQLQRPDKTSRTSSKPPSTDKKERRENARPGGAKPGHEPHNRRLVDNPDEFRDHRRTRCAQCGGAVAIDADMELIGEYDEIEIPPVRLSRDNLDDEPATIRMTRRRRRGDEGRA
jgi:transposase